jgi:hypothetical protein
MTLTLKKDIKLDNKTLVKGTTAKILGISNSENIKKSYNQEKPEGWFFVAETKEGVRFLCEVGLSEYQ